MDTLLFALSLQVAANADARVCLPVDASENWEIQELTIIPNVTSTADGTNYQSLRWYKGASTAVTAARTTAATDLTQGTQEAMAITATGADKVISSSAPLSLRATKAGTGVAADVTALIRLKRLRS